MLHTAWDDYFPIDTLGVPESSMLRLPAYHKEYDQH